MGLKAGARSYDSCWFSAEGSQAGGLHSYTTQEMALVQPTWATNVNAVQALMTVWFGLMHLHLLAGSGGRGMLAGAGAS